MQHPEAEEVSLHAPLQSKLGFWVVSDRALDNAERRERERACGQTFQDLDKRRRWRLDAQEPRNIGAEVLRGVTRTGRRK
jgi:hypothetical protein